MSPWAVGDLFEPEPGLAAVVTAVAERLPDVTVGGLRVAGLLFPGGWAVDWRAVEPRADGAAVTGRSIR